MTKSRILIVEDEAVTAIDLTETLEALGYEPLPAVLSGEAAVEQARELSPDLILMDIQLQGEMDGIQAAARIWDETSIPIIFLTAYADEETLSRAKLVHPFGFVLKPFKERELHATIQLALENFQSNYGEADPNQKVRTNGHDSRELELVELGNREFTPLEFLKRIDPVRELPESALKELADASTFQSFEKNERIWDEGQDSTHGFIVARGRIALLKSTVAGKELTLALLPPGDIFGLVALIENSTAPYTATAQTESQILAVPTTLLHQQLAQHPELYKEFSEEMRLRLERAHTFSLRLAHERVEVRVAAALIELASDFGSYDQATGVYTLEVTRQQLAQVAGTTPETAIRLTRSMEEDGLLDLKKPGQIRVLKRDSLEQLAGEVEAAMSA